MSEWFFSDPDRVAPLLQEAAEWRHTPFRRRSHTKGIGGGTDCVGLCESLLKAAGAIRADFSFPRSRHDYSPHVMNDKILRYLRGQHEDEQSKELAARFAELSVDPVPVLMPGDILIMKTGLSLYHMPIVLDPPRAIQCAAPLGVSECDATDPQYRDRIETIFRARA